MTKICALIPSYNVAKTIGPIVQELRRRDLDVLVVDDGSTDLTSEAAGKSGAAVLRNEVNCGKGVSLRRGFRYVVDKGYDAAVTIDGDGQHLPEDVEKFLKAQSLNPGAGLIIGNRMQCPAGMPLVRLLTNRFMSVFISWLCRQHIPDSQNGFRLIKRGVLQEIKLKCNRFEIESEIILEAAKKNVQIISIPICSLYQKHSSAISPLRDTIRFIKFIFTHLKSTKKEQKPGD